MIAMTGSAESQLEEVRSTIGNATHLVEAGRTYVAIKAFRLPEGCSPATTDVLLFPESGGSGYESRLYFADRVTGLKADTLNWQPGVHIAGKTWQVFSWQTDAQPRSYLEKIALHVRAFITGRT